MDDLKFEVSHVVLKRSDRGIRYLERKIKDLITQPFLQEHLDEIEKINNIKKNNKDIDNLRNELKIYKQRYKNDKNIQEQLNLIQQQLNTLKNIQEQPQKLEKNDILENFDKYYNDFVTYKNKIEKLSNSSMKNYNSCWRYLKYFIDENTVLNFKFFKEFQSNLQQLPANFFKYKQYYEKTFKEIQEIRKIDNFETLKNKTINNHISTLKKFYDYLIYEEITEENPLINIKFLKEEESDKEEYSKEDLDKIFNSDIEKIYFNMCKFCLYTGLRIEELLNIKKEDIKDNLLYITLDDTSNKKHKRVIPIHDNLKNLIEEQKKTSKLHKYLFFDIEKNNKNKDDEVRNIGKRINRRLQKIINDENKTFHCLRKNFSQEIELNTNSEEKTKKYLVGHSLNKDITHTIYNKNKININKLIDCINQISFKY